MSRWIDADKLKEKLKASPSYRDYEWSMYAEEFIEEMDEEPSIDLVRCKECKYLCHYTDGHIECRLLAELKPIPTTYCTMNPDDFCSYGERRE